MKLKEEYIHIICKIIIIILHIIISIYLYELITHLGRAINTFDRICFKTAHVRIELTPEDYHDIGIIDFLYVFSQKKIWKTLICLPLVIVSLIIPFLKWRSLPVILLTEIFCYFAIFTYVLLIIIKHIIFFINFI